MEWQKLLCEKRRRKSKFGKDRRTQFERDLDRTMFSTPVKRLQDKTQVFPLEPNDAIRTRLTHSLEVMIVSKNLAIDIGKWLFENGHIKEGRERDIENIAATCGLIHDLGNPPFGHSGEVAIQNWFSERKELSKELINDEQLINDFLKFESNAQTLRLLSKLQILNDPYGLNLTYGTLSASCKYLAKSNIASKDNEKHSYSKPGFFASENNLIEQIRNKTGTGEALNPITYLVSAADDIVYLAADIEDAIKKEEIEWKKINNVLEEKKDKFIDETFKIMKKILDISESKNIYDDLRDDIYASAFRTAVVNILVKSTLEEFKKQYKLIIEGQYYCSLLKSCDASSYINILKEIGEKYVFPSKSILKLELMGRQIINDLMTIFWEGANDLVSEDELNTKKFSGKVGFLFSENYRKVYFDSIKENLIIPKIYHKYQLVTDYICGMTDSFAKQLHAELKNG